LARIDTPDVKMLNEIKKLREAVRGTVKWIASACRATAFHAEAHQTTRKVRLPQPGADERGRPLSASPSVQRSSSPPVPASSDLSLLGDLQGVVYLDSEVPHGRLQPMYW